MAEKSPLFLESLGSSKRLWHSTSMGTMGPVDCELCGKEWPKVPPEETSRSLGVFLGRQFVEECCGAMIDELYHQFGELFAEAYLEDFAKNPGNPDLAFFRMCLLGSLQSAKEASEKTIEEVGELQVLTE